MELELKLKEIKEQKALCVKNQKYEDAAMLRDKERKLIEDLYKTDKYKEGYNNYIKEKSEEFSKSIEPYYNTKDIKDVIDFFNYAKNNLQLNGFRKGSHIVSPEFRSKMFGTSEDNLLTIQEAAQNLNKWIIENMITFEQWYNKYTKN